MSDPNEGLNVFRWCTCLRHVGKLMVLFVLALTCVTVLAVGQTALRWLQAPAAPVLNAVGGSALVALGVLCVMVLWSYLTCVMTEAGRVPPGWHPFSDDDEAAHARTLLEHNPYHFGRTDPRRPRFCRKCSAWKPERTHHCSISGHCVLRMDHYCIWVVNVVGLLNYKAFLLFVLYAFAAELLAAAVLLPPTMATFTDVRAGSEVDTLPLVGFVLGVAFSLSLSGFLVVHWQMLSANCTSIEMYEKRRVRPWPYDRGLRRNFEEVFGRSRLRWFIPGYSAAEKRAIFESAIAPRLQHVLADSAAAAHGDEGACVVATDGHDGSVPLPHDAESV